MVARRAEASGGLVRPLHKALERRHGHRQSHEIEFEDIECAGAAPVRASDGQYSVISPKPKLVLVIEDDELLRDLYLTHPDEQTIFEDPTTRRFQFKITVGDQVDEFSYSHSGEAPEAICLAPGDLPIVAGTADGIIERFSSEGIFGSAFEGHHREVRFVAVTGSKRLLVSEARDETFRVWRSPTALQWRF